MKLDRVKTLIYFIILINSSWINLYFLFTWYNFEILKYNLGV